jgi:hypothetical protein
MGGPIGGLIWINRTTIPFSETHKRLDNGRIPLSVKARQQRSQEHQDATASSIEEASGPSAAQHVALAATQSNGRTPGDDIVRGDAIAHRRSEALSGNQQQQWQSKRLCRLLLEFGEQNVGGGCRIVTKVPMTPTSGARSGQARPERLAVCARVSIIPK